MRRVKGLMFLAVTAMIVFGLVAGAYAAVGSDVKGTKYETPVSQLTALGIVTGYEDGSIKPDQTITRAEFCAIAVRGTNMKGVLTSSATQFFDVPASHWASGYIALAAGRGYIVGYPDGSFQPENQVTIAEAVAILDRILGFEPAIDSSNWPDSYIAKGAEIGVTKGVSVNANSPAPRGDVFMMTANSLDIDIMKQVQYGTETIYEVQDDPSKTILSEYFDIDIIDEDWANDENDGDLPIVNKVPMINISKMDSNEIAFLKYNSATTYEVVAGIEPNSFLGQEVLIWVDEDEDLVYYIEASGNETILFEEIESLDTDSDKLYTELANDDYDIETDANVWIVGDKDVDKWSDIVANYDDEDLADLVLANVKVILNEDDDVAAMVITDFYNNTVGETESGVVYEIDKDDENISYYNESGDEDEISLEDEDYILVKNGVPAALADLAEGDVLNIISVDDDYYLVATSTQVNGPCTEVRYSSQSKQNSYDIFVDGKKYDLPNAGSMQVCTFSEDNNDSVDEITNDDLIDLKDQTVTLYLDAQGNVRHVVAEASGTNRDLVGAVTESAYMDTGKKVTFTMINKEGKEVTYTFDNSDVDLYGVEDVKPDDASDDDFKDALTIGEERDGSPYDFLVALEYDMDRNGDLDEITIIKPKFAKVGDAELDEDDDTIELNGGTYNVTGSTIIFDLTGDFDGEEIDDADVITWDSLKNYDDNEDMTIGYTTDGEDAEYLWIISEDSTLTSGDYKYGLVTKLGTQDDEDIAYLRDSEGNEITIVIEDATVAQYVYGASNNALKQGDFIQYDVDAKGEADDIYILARLGDVVLDIDGTDLDDINIDKAAYVTVKTSSSTSIKDVDDNFYTLNSSTVFFQDFDVKQLKVVSGVKKGQNVLLIDTDDDGGAYDYVVITKDN